MTAFGVLAVAVAWAAIGLAAAAWLARHNQARGVRRVTVLERRVGLLYLAGAIAGPLAWVLALAVRAALTRLDRAAERAAAAEAKARAERARERSKARQTAS